MAEGAQAAQRGETGAIRVHAEVMPHHVDAVHRFERGVFLAAIEGVHRDLMAGLHQPAGLLQHARVWGAGVGDEHHHLAHGMRRAVEAMRIRRAVSG